MLYLAIFLHFETIQKHSILSQALLWFCHFVIIFCPFSQVTLKSELALRKSSFCAIQLFHSSHCLTFPQVLMVNQVLTACSWYDCALLWSVQTGSILQRFAPHDAVSCRAENLVKLVFDKDSQKDLGFVIFLYFFHGLQSMICFHWWSNLCMFHHLHITDIHRTSPKCTWNKNITFGPSAAQFHQGCSAQLRFAWYVYRGNGHLGWSPDALVGSQLGGSVFGEKNGKMAM